jgi:hypothetical protein
MFHSLEMGHTHFPAKMYELFIPSHVTFPNEFVLSEGVGAST